MSGEGEGEGFAGAEGGIYTAAEQRVRVHNTPSGTTRSDSVFEGRSVIEMLVRSKRQPS